MADDPNEDDSWLYGNPDENATTATTSADNETAAASTADTSTTTTTSATTTATADGSASGASQASATGNRIGVDEDQTDNFVEADPQDDIANVANGTEAAASQSSQPADDATTPPPGGSPAADQRDSASVAARDNDNDSYNDDDEDDDDDINVVIGAHKPETKTEKAGQTYNIKQRPPLLGPGGTTAVTGEPAKPKQAPGKFSIDEFESVGTIAGVPAHEFSIDSLDEKPWRKPGADITDYFNYGFNEDTWRAYCERQKQMRLNESGVGLQGLSVGIPATVKNEYRERMMGERRGQGGGQGGGGQGGGQGGGGGPGEGEFGGAGGFRTDGGAGNMLGGFMRRAGPPPGRKVMGQIDVIGSNGMHSRRDQDGHVGGVGGIGGGVGGIGIGVLGSGPGGPLLKGAPIPTKENVIQVMTAERREYSRIQGAFPPVGGGVGISEPFFEPEPNYNYGYEPTQEQQWNNSDQPQPGWTPTGIKELTSGPGQPIASVSSGGHHSMRALPGAVSGRGDRGGTGAEGGGRGDRERERERDRDRLERGARDYGSERGRDRVKSEDRRERDRGDRSSRRGGAEAVAASTSTRERSRSRERRRRSKSREKEREKEREKDRDKERDKDRDKDREKDRDKDRKKERDDDRKSRDRKKSHKKDKEIKEERESE